MARGNKKQPVRTAYLLYTKLHKQTNKTTKTTPRRRDTSPKGSRVTPAARESAAPEGVHHGVVDTLLEATPWNALGVFECLAVGVDELLVLKDGVGRFEGTGVVGAVDRERCASVANRGAVVDRDVRDVSTRVVRDRNTGRVQAVSRDRTHEAFERDNVGVLRLVTEATKDFLEELVHNSLLSARVSM